jgi:DNA-directed RNA polymerase subunit M/transcription elongation factor TFIIS
MKFCQCGNMLYVSVDSADKKLEYYCKTCNNREKKDAQESELIISDNKIDDTIKYSKYINKYIKYDPSLPRVNNITCVNTNCTKKHDQMSEVIFIKYDAVNMKYLYYCVHCDNFWKP